MTGRLAAGAAIPDATESIWPGRGNGRAAAALSSGEEAAAGEASGVRETVRRTDGGVTAKIA